jgi:hypothetical protein
MQPGRVEGPHVDGRRLLSGRRANILIGDGQLRVGDDRYRALQVRDANGALQFVADRPHVKAGLSGPQGSSWIVHLVTNEATPPVIIRSAALSMAPFTFGAKSWTASFAPLTDQVNAPTGREVLYDVHVGANTGDYAPLAGGASFNMIQLSPGCMTTASLQVRTGRLRIANAQCTDARGTVISLDMGEAPLQVRGSLISGPSQARLLMAGVPMSGRPGLGATSNMVNIDEVAGAVIGPGAVEFEVVGVGRNGFVSLRGVRTSPDSAASQRP